MQHILSRRSRSTLEELARQRLLVAFDYDGTLAPIVSDPERSAMRPETRALLEQLARLYPCVVISGRTEDDVRRRLRGTGVRQVIGNNGLLPWSGLRPLLARVQRWLPALEAALSGYRGVAIENKRISIAVHYRRARDKRRARSAILRATMLLYRPRIVEGKDVVHLLPEGAPLKGTALRRARMLLRCETALYVGDDETDEDVFALDEPGSVLAVRVGPRKSSRGQPLPARAGRDRRAPQGAHRAAGAVGRARTGVTAGPAQVSHCRRRSVPSTTLGQLAARNASSGSWPTASARTAESAAAPSKST
jgi:trehalose 6-phosphate phosphatase